MSRRMYIVLGFESWRFWLEITSAVKYSTSEGGRINATRFLPFRHHRVPNFHGLALNPTNSCFAFTSSVLCHSSSILVTALPMSLPAFPARWAAPACAA